jgi:hypothetical protein
MFASMAIVSSCKLLPDAISGATSKYYKNGNSLYHQTDETKLQVGEINIEGEVKNPGKVKLRNLYKREVFYKQATLGDSGKINFVGAYRYRGYSLFDMLNSFIVEKKNLEEFRPSTDLYIIIENDKGDRVTFSWNEIFFTHFPHQVIIATESAPIKPYKREVEYPTGTSWKVVASTDLFAYRELENPTKIIVKSFDKKTYEINRKLEDPYSPKVDIVVDNLLKRTIGSEEQFADKRKYNAVFYGLGMGYHDTPNFQGFPLRPCVEEYFAADAESWQSNGLVCAVGKDGFRNIFSVGELFNRVDGVEPILAIPPVKESGHYRLYHPSAFYADFSVRNLKELNFFKE